MVLVAVLFVSVQYAQAEMLTISAVNEDTNLLIAMAGYLGLMK